MAWWLTAPISDAWWLTACMSDHLYLMACNLWLGGLSHSYGSVVDNVYIE